MPTGDSQFQDLPEGDCSRWINPRPKSKIGGHQSARQGQEVKCLIPLTTKSGEIIWVHSDIVKDEQWESSPPKVKDKLCSVISLTQDDDAMTVASLSSSEEEKCAFTAQLATPQPVGTRSGKQYLRQYDLTPDETQQPTMSGDVAPVQASTQTLPLDKEKQKEVRFDKALKKNFFQGLNTPFRFDILAQLVNIPTRITLHELLRLLKETREAVRDVLADSELFLIQVPSILTDDDRTPCPQCHMV